MAENPIESEALSSLSESFANSLAYDRTLQLKERAAVYFSDLARQFMDQDVTQRRPEAEARWEAWSTNVIKPVLNASPDNMRIWHYNPATKASLRPSLYSFKVDFRVPFENRGVTTKLPISIVMTPEDEDTYTYDAADAHKDFADAKALARLNSQDIDRITKRNDFELAKRLDYTPILKVTGKSRILRRPISASFINPQEILVIAKDRRQALISKIVMESIDFTLDSRTLNTDLRDLHGRVVSPKRRNIDSPYSNYISNHKEGQLTEIINKLTEDELEQAASKEMSSSSVLDIITDRAHKHIDSLAKEARIADEMLNIILKADEFKQLIDA